MHLTASEAVGTVADLVTPLWADCAQHSH